ncbi:hypothetical protein GGF37_001737, partial [Kickxella alabastrina]
VIDTICAYLDINCLTIKHKTAINYGGAAPAPAAAADAASEDDADIEDGPSSKGRRKRLKSEPGSRRHLPANPNIGTLGQQSSRSASPQRMANHNELMESSQRKHRPSKRRKPRYDEPDYVDSNGSPQLVYFASKGDVETCRKLLLRGASINSADTHGWTALHEASKHSHIGILDLLLKPPTRARQHSEIEPGSDGSTASDPSESRLVRQLRSPLPNMNATTLHSRLTPLHQAVVNEDLQAVRLLLDNGASTSISNSRQLTPLDTCSDEKIARLLTDRAKTQRLISSRDKAGQTKLHRACNAGDLEQTISLVSQGADINMKDNAGWTPLHEAALEGHNSVVVALLRRGADHSAKGFGGDTPLHDACANGHYDVVRSLLVVGADPQLKNSKGITAEDMALEEEQDEVLQLIEQYRRGRPRISQRPSQTNINAVVAGKAIDLGKGKRRVVDRPLPPKRSIKGNSRKAGSSSSDSGSGDSDDGVVASSKGSARVVAKPPPIKSKKSIAKGGSSSQERRSQSVQSRRSASPDANASSSQKRELLALKRLRKEAEKPLVNYYFTSNTSKLSRDERKLQVLMGTIERMEKRKPKEKEKQRQSLGNIGAASVHDIAAIATDDTVLSADHDMGTREDANGASGANDGDDCVRGRQSSRSISPRRRRGRPPKKRIIDDDDDDRNVDDDVACSLQKQQPTWQGRAKRPRNATETIEPLADSGNRPHGRHSVITIDGTGSKTRGAVQGTIQPDSMVVTSVTPTVNIKTESVSAAPSISNSKQQQQQPAVTTNGTRGEIQPRSRSSSSHRDKSAKHRSEGGRTIVEDPTAAGLRRADNITPESIAAQAIRYLPLYTIQLHCDPPTSKLDYFVVDLQIRLLLGMPIDTPSGMGSGVNNEDNDSDNVDEPDANPLFEAYPHIYRQRITDSQKEHLWEPLAGMFVSNLQFIHETTKAGDHAVSSKTFNDLACSSESSVDSELVSQFTLHEKKKFVALSLYFVKLDEIVELVRRDYPKISQQLITISLDLSTMGIAEMALPLPRGQPPKPAVKAVRRSETQIERLAWNGPQNMVPLKYALKLHYRNSLTFDSSNSGAQTEESGTS